MLSGGLIIYVSYNGGREEVRERGRERERERERLVRGGGSPILFYRWFTEMERYCTVGMSIVVVALGLLFYYHSFQLQPPDERLLCYYL